MTEIDFSPMKDKPETPKVGVGVLIWKGAKDALLLGKRRGSHGAGKWGLPGGHVELGDTFEGTCIRETFEETGIKIDTICCDNPFITENIMGDEGLHYITVFCQAVWDKKQEPVYDPNEKFEEWRWVEWGDWNDLELFAGLAKRLKLEW